MSSLRVMTPRLFNRRSRCNRASTATWKLLHNNNGPARPTALVGRSRGSSFMQTFFVEIKCALGRTYEVASALAEAEIASENYSIAGDFHILAQFYVDSDVDM